MKTQVTLTIDSEIKTKFQKIAKKLWSNMSTIANMYFTQVVNTGKIEYHTDTEDIEMWFIPYEKLSSEDKEAVDRIDRADPSSFINI